MYNKTTFVIAAVVFALVGTLVFAAVAPQLQDVDAQEKPKPVERQCSDKSPDGRDGDLDDDGNNNYGRKGCGPNEAKRR